MEEENSKSYHSQGLFQSRDGTTLYYEVQGEGPVLVFCYGLLCRREHWHHQIQHFLPNYRVVTFDYRGHHSSGRPANDRHLTIEWCANDLADVLNHLDIQDAVVLGHSMGVPIVSRFLAESPSRVRAAVFICGTVTNPFEAMFHSNRMNTVFKVSSAIYDHAPGLMSGIWKRFTAHNRLNFFMTARLGFNASVSEEKDVMNYMEGVNRTPFSIFYSLMKDYVEFDGRPYLKKILIPTLVVAGENDHITPIAIQEEIAALLPKGTLVRIPEGSHNAHTDFPIAVNIAIENFLKGLR